MNSIDDLIANPLLAGYLTILLLAGIGSAVIFLSGFPKQVRLGLPGTTPWFLRISDFVLFVCMFLVWYLIASSLTIVLARKLTPEDSEPSIFLLAAGNLILHGGLILLFWRWREIHRSLEERVLSTRPMSLPAAFGSGLFLMLAAYPFVIMVALIWQGILTLGKNAGLNINLAPQTAIELFQQTSDPLSFLALAFVAVVMAPIAEELIFRAGFYRWFRGRMGIASGMVLSGMIFAFLHGHLLGFMPLAALGILFCLAYEWTGNIKVPIIMHALFNLNTLILLFFSKGSPVE